MQLPMYVRVLQGEFNYQEGFYFSGLVQKSFSFFCNHILAVYLPLQTYTNAKKEKIIWFTIPPSQDHSSPNQSQRLWDTGDNTTSTCLMTICFTWLKIPAREFILILVVDMPKAMTARLFFKSCGCGFFCKAVSLDFHLKQ